MCEEPIRRSLTKWRLLKRKGEEGDGELPAKRRKRLPESKPEAVINLLPTDWEWEGRGFRIVVDCQPLARALNGVSPWTNGWGGGDFSLHV